MQETTDLTILVSPCGLYCGACHRFKKEKCPGCAEHEKATWCKIRSCTREQGYATCAECTEFNDVNDCKKFNTIFSKFFYYVFKSDRKASLARIVEVGLEQYAKEMDERNIPVIKRGGK